MLLDADYTSENDLLIALTRDTILRYALLLAFWVLQIAGLVLAFRMYREVSGDNLTKIVAVMPPLFFLNLTAMLCIPDINAARERIAHLRKHLTCDDSGANDKDIR